MKGYVKHTDIKKYYSFNTKYGKHKQVNIINMYDIDTIKRYNIDKLYNRFCGNEKDKQEGTGDKITQFTIASTNIPYCIEKIIVEGSNEGTRYEDLQKIVVTLRNRNKSLNRLK